MFVVASVLLLAGVGFLVVALVTGPIVLAWGSIAASAVAALALIVQWRRQRRSAGRRRASAAAGPRERKRRRQRGKGGSPKPRRPEPGSGEPGSQRGGPAEEDTDAADLILVCELADEVLVVDERPRYHLDGCAWLESRPTEPLPVHEARQLGFTPCVQCGPDAELARRHRATSTG